MMRGKGLLGPFFGKHVGRRSSHPLAHTAGNFLSAEARPEGFEFEMIVGVNVQDSASGFKWDEYGASDPTEMFGSFLEIHQGRGNTVSDQGRIATTDTLLGNPFLGAEQGFDVEYDDGTIIGPWVWTTQGGGRYEINSAEPWDYFRPKVGQTIYYNIINLIPTAFVLNDGEVVTHLGETVTHT